MLASSTITKNSLLQQTRTLSISQNSLLLLPRILLKLFVEVLIQFCLVSIALSTPGELHMSLGMNWLDPICPQGKQVPGTCWKTIHRPVTINSHKLSGVHINLSTVLIICRCFTCFCMPYTFGFELSLVRAETCFLCGRCTTFWFVHFLFFFFSHLLKSTKNKLNQLCISWNIKDRKT